MKKTTCRPLFPAAFILLMLTVSCSTGSRQADLPRPGNRESFAVWTGRLLEERVGKEKLTGGMTAMVYADGEVLYAGGSGMADAEAGRGADGETPMPVGSISKLFTATAVMMLVEEGRIDPDAPVSAYLPRLKMAGGAENRFTVRDLLTHHSGLPGDLFGGWFPEEPGTENLQQLYPLLEGRPAAAEPGRLFSYSNIGFSLLGMMVEEVSGQAYEDFIRGRIFTPAGMTHSAVYPGENGELLPRGYRKKESLPVPLIRDIPAGNLAVSAADMGAFVRALYGGDPVLLSPDTLAEMQSVQNPGNIYDRAFEIGLGWWLIEPLNSGEKMASHGGDLPPFHSVLITLPERDLAVFVASNDESGSPMEAALEIVEELMVWSGLPRPVPAEKGGFVPVPEEDKALYAGIYNTLAGPVEVTPRGKGLSLEISGKNLRFAPRENGRYGVQYRLLGVVPLPVAQLEMMEFDMYRAGGEVWMGLWIGGIYLGTFSRLGPVTYSEEFSVYGGGYETEEGGGEIDNIRIFERDGRYYLGVSLLGMPVELALRPDGPARALTDGTGRGMGDVLEFRDSAGGIVLEWSGMTLRQIRE